MKQARVAKKTAKLDREKQLAAVRVESRRLFVRLAFALVVILALGLGVVFARRASAPSPGGNFAIAALAGHPFKLDIANTPVLRQQGLSDRPGLAEDQGMLFEFQTPSTTCFWMKGMRFNLDILWFDAGKKLIYQQQNLVPASYPQSFCPPSPASYVVEINPGVVQLKTGDPLVLQKQ